MRFLTLRDAEIAVRQAERLRHQPHQKRRPREGAEQRAQFCLARTHVGNFPCLKDFSPRCYCSPKLLSASHSFQQLAEGHP